MRYFLTLQLHSRTLSYRNARCSVQHFYLFIYLFLAIVEHWKRFQKCFLPKNYLANYQNIIQWNMMELIKRNELNKYVSTWKGFPGGSVVKKLHTNAGDAGSISGSGRYPGERNGNQLSILAWEIPWTVEPGGLQFIGLQRVEHNWSNLARTHQDFEDLLQDHTMHSFSLSPSRLLYAKPSSSILISYCFWLLVTGSQISYSGYFSLT